MRKVTISIVLINILMLSIVPVFSFEAVDIESVPENDIMATIPLYFVENLGQISPSVRYYVEGGSFTAYFEDDAITYAYGYGEGNDSGIYVIRQEILGGNPSSVRGVKQTEAKFNRFIGNDPDKWVTDIPSYGGVLYEDIYPGIDLYFYGEGRNIKYEFVVNSSPDVIGMSYSGQEKLSLDDMGDLLLETKVGAFKEKRPYTYQIIDGEKKEIDSSFVIVDNFVHFEIGNYDLNYPLVIDPMVYSTYVGGTGLQDDVGLSIVVDSNGNAYVTGLAAGIVNWDLGAYDRTDFPVTPGAFQTTFMPTGSHDLFVLKLNSAGTGLVYSTLFGGSASEYSSSIAVDSSGNVYAGGTTSSSNIPITPGAYQPTLIGGVATSFIFKLNPAGSALLYSTYMGTPGSGQIYSIAVDSSGNVYAAGETGSTNFPTTIGAYQTTYAGGNKDAFILKLNPAGGGSSDLIYSTYVGGSGSDSAYSIAVDSSGNAYASGSTASTNFPTTSGAYQSSNAGNNDAFVLKLNPAGGGSSDLIYSTYVGGSGYDFAYSIELDSSGNVYAAGDTGSTNFPTTIGAYQTTYAGGNKDAFILKLNPAGGGSSDLIYSTYVGGSGSDSAYSIAVDSSGNAYAAGLTGSTNFPTTIGAYQSSNAGSNDAFVLKLNPAGGGSSDLIYSTYVGGSGRDTSGGINPVGTSTIAVDSSGNVYATGLTASTDFPTTAGAYQTTYAGGAADAFIFKLSPIGIAPIALSSSISASPGTVTTGQTITVTMTVNNTGGEQANSVTPSALTQGGTGAISGLSGPSPASADIAAGGNQTFTWTCTASTAGTKSFTGNATGTGAVSGSSASSTSTTSNIVTIITPAAITSSISGAPVVVTPGQTITVNMTVQNSGQERVLNVVPSALLNGGTATATILTGPIPITTDLEGGSQTSFVWTFRADTPGIINFTGNATGTSEISSNLILSSSSTSNDITVLETIGLASSMSALPQGLKVGQNITVTMTVQNTGGETAVNVVPSVITNNAPSSLKLVSGPTPASTSIQPSSQETFTWIYTVNTAGMFNFTANASGEGYISGTHVSSPLSTSNDVFASSNVSIFGALQSAYNLRAKTVEGLKSQILDQIPSGCKESGVSSSTCNIPDEIKLLWAEAEMHMEKSRNTGNAVEALNELKKAKEFYEQILEILSSK